MKTEKQISLVKKTTLISFIVGTLIFGLYYFTSNYLLLFLGAAFIILAIPFNLIILILTLGHAKHDIKNRIRLLKASSLLLINIPIVLVYSWISLLLLDYMRITFTNETDYKLTEININGCETKYIPKLEPNESKTVWVGIPSDCSVNIDYIGNGVKKTENVVGYVTNSNGKKINYKIKIEN